MQMCLHAGEKSGGAWEHGIITGASFWRGPSPAAVAAAASASGSPVPPRASITAAQAAWLEAAPQELPTVVIVCNSAPPDAAVGQPGLLSLREAETIFVSLLHRF
jgi:Zn-dependent oligopeptidase